MKTHFFSFLFICLFTNTFSSIAFSNSVEVVDVSIKAQGENQYRFDVTLRHEDTGWEHYANRWEILDLEGNVLATRTLHHPHVNEQPFTRSLSATLPSDIKSVILRGHDSVHKYGIKEMKVTLP